MSTFIQITSATNALIKETAKLKKQKGSLKLGDSFLLEGLRLCEDALRNKALIKSAFVTNSFLASHPNLCNELEQSDIICYQLADFLGEKLGDTKTPQGIFFTCQVPVQLQLQDTLKEKHNLLILDGVSDPGNLGTILRTAVGLGIHHIALLNKCTSPHSPKAMRAGMGTSLRVNFYTEENAKELASALKQASYTLYSSALQENSRSLSNIPIQFPYALVIGSEARGVSADLLNESDVTVTIPMALKTESLNASAAAAILLWEFQKNFFM